MKILIGKEANDFLEGQNIGVVFYEVANSLEDASRKLNKFSFPMVLKLISQDALHKTEIGGVKIVKNREDFEGAFEDLVGAAKKHKVKVDNILMQEFVEGVELIIGLKKDFTFGYVVMLGIGGIYVEALRDVAFRVCPINERDASSMLEELKAKSMILGEGERLDVEKLKKFLVRLSKLPKKKKGIVELDINPLVLNGDDVRVVDARISFD